MKNLFFLLCLLSANVGADTLLDTPRGGWNVSGLTDRAETPGTSYPYSPIDRGVQRNRRLIEGRIHKAGRSRAQLIINGNPTALNTGQDGRFARFYAFGAGSNSIEVRAGKGERKRVQFYEAKAGQATAQMRIICSWDAPDTEIDLHIITPDGQHAFFGRPVLNGGGGLDGDSVDGPGPEMFTMIAPQHGVYHVFVNYWGNYGEGGYNFDESRRELPIVTARVTLILQENTVHEKRESFVVPLRKIGDLNLIKAFNYP